MSTGNKLLRLAKPLPLAPHAKDAFSRGYVESLRQEIKKVRETAHEAAARAAGLEAARAETQAQADARVIQAVLRTLARGLRIHDVEDLSLLDASGLTVDAAGEVPGAAELLEAFRREKPFLFNSNTSSPHTPLPPSR